jgi:hypothetical protein
MMKRPFQPDRIIPLLLIAGGFLLILSVVIWFALSTQNAVPTSSNSNLFSTNIPAPEIARVSLANAKTALDDKQALFVDVRDSGSYASAHIAGAINIPLADLESRLNELPRDQWIITYCT